MEHIPVEWEFDVLSEEIRVAKKYVLHANAMGDAYLDSISKSAGFDEVHVNVKNNEQWLKFYEENSLKLNYTIQMSECINGTFYIILKKNK
jgi:hypothetical protein